MNGRTMLVRAFGDPGSGERGLGLAIVCCMDTAQPFAATSRWNGSSGLVGRKHPRIDVEPSRNLAPFVPIGELFWIGGRIDEPATAEAKVLPDLFGELCPQPQRQIGNRQFTCI